MFPLMPAEVFDEWLGGLIGKQGWPFRSPHDSIYVQNWAGMLLDMPLTEWADVIWSKRTLEKDAMRIVPGSVELIVQVAMHFVTSRGTDTGRQIANSRERSRAMREHIESTGCFPGFITAIQFGDGRLQLADGHHRLGACWSLQIPKTIPAWIGVAPK
jgi:hypothetical protein